jgi:hypothetical protein
MNFDWLFCVLTTIHPVSEKFKLAVEKELIPLDLPKNYFLLEAPGVSRHAYFLNTGFAMSFSFVEGEKHVDGFWQPGEIIMAARSFMEQVPSLEYIQLMERSEVLCISHESVMKLFERFPEANAIYRLVMNQYYEQAKEKLRDWQYYSAQQRHEKLLRRFPRIEQIVAQQYIAAYLGIKPQSLSRMKRQGRA